MDFIIIAILIISIIAFVWYLTSTNVESAVTENISNVKTGVISAESDIAAYEGKVETIVKTEVVSVDTTIKADVAKL